MAHPYLKCKGTQEVHLMVMKEEVESRDLVMAHIPIEVQTLLEEFDNVIPEDLPTELPPMRASLPNVPHYSMSSK